MTCRYYDCGWCYAPEDVKNNSIQGGCFEPEYCATYLMQNKPKMTDKPFYRFFAIDYCATGEGRSYFLTICRNYQIIDGRDREMERFKEFIGHSHYYPGIEELTEEEFLEKYAKLIPEHTRMMIHRRDQPIFTWETHIHFNYS